MLLEHLRTCPHSLPSQQVPRSVDPEDGFDTKIDNLLKTRVYSQKLNRWEDIYKLLFPDSESVPDSGKSPSIPGRLANSTKHLGKEFEPIRDHHAIAALYTASKAAMKAALGDRIGQRISGLTAMVASEFTEIAMDLFDERLSPLLKHSKCGPWGVEESQISPATVTPAQRQSPEQEYIDLAQGQTDDDPFLGESFSVLSPSMTLLGDNETIAGVDGTQCRNARLDMAPSATQQHAVGETPTVARNIQSLHDRLEMSRAYPDDHTPDFFEPVIPFAIQVHCSITDLRGSSNNTPTHYPP